MPSRDLCKIHEGMFDKPEGVARGFITHSRDHLILPHVVADSQLPTIPTPKSAHLIYTSAALTLMGLYREIC